MTGVGAAVLALSMTLDAELAAIVNDREQPLASLSVLVVRGGEVVYHKQFGNATGDKPADATTLYRIASITKLVVALGVMRLVEDGKLDLDRDVSEYLGFVLRNPYFRDTPVTLRMLLSHTSSLRDDVGYFWPEGTRLREIFASGAGMWSPQKPGDHFSYCNLAWGVIGTVMERVGGERFDLLMQRLVIEPLGLSGGFSPAHMPPERVRSIATLYRQGAPQVDDYSKEPPVSRASPRYEIGSNGTLFGPAGNLRASAADLGRVLRMLMNRGEIDGRRYLRPETVDVLLERHWDRGHGNTDFGGQKDKFNAWGLGNQHFLDVGGPGRGDRLVEGGGFTGVGHHGDAYGLTGILAFNRESRDGFVFLVGGAGVDPHATKGRYSSFHRYEERIMTALHRLLRPQPARAR